MLTWVYAGTRRPQLRTALEVIYGGLNPLLYLLVFQPAFQRDTTPWILAVVQWGAFASFWIARLLGPAFGLNEGRARRLIGTIAALALAVVAFSAARDLVVGFAGDFRIVVPAALLSPLYLLPALVLLDFRQQPDPAEFFLAPRLAGALTVVAIPFLVLSAVLLSWSPSRGDARELVLAHEQQLRAAAEEAHLDPRLLAAILVVGTERHTSQLGMALEAAAATMWGLDDGNHALLADAFNPSLGLMQVKPVTVQVAQAAQWKARGERWIPGKEYRCVLAPPAAYERIAKSAMARLHSPPVMSKPELVRALLEPSTNFELAAYVLDVTATQWKGTDN